MTRRSLSASFLINVSAATWLSCAALAALILIWQVFVWLRYGYWQPVTVWSLMLQAGLDIPEVRWFGIQKMILWTADQSASLFLALCSVASLWFGIWVAPEEPS